MANNTDTENDTAAFWRAVHSGLMPKGDAWADAVGRVPALMSAAEAGGLLQSAEQLLTLSGRGHMNGALATTALDKEAVAPFLSDAELSLEGAALQWLYRFPVVEGLSEHSRRLALGEWNPMFLGLVEEGLHFMTYMAALLVLMEEGQLPNPMDRAAFPDTEPAVRARVASACGLLLPKARDYGESFRRHGLPGLLPRLWDKAARYANLGAVPGANFESRGDSARDLLGYSCIAYSLLLELPAEVRRGYERKRPRLDSGPTRY